MRTLSSISLVLGMFLSLTANWLSAGERPLRLPWRLAQPGR